MESLCGLISAKLALRSSRRGWQQFRCWYCRILARFCQCIVTHLSHNISLVTFNSMVHLFESKGISSIVEWLCFANFKIKESFSVLGVANMHPPSSLVLFISSEGLCLLLLVTYVTLISWWLLEAWWSLGGGFEIPNWWCKWSWMIQFAGVEKINM